MVALFNFVTLVRFVVLKSLLKLYISDDPLPENLRKPGILSRIVVRRPRSVRIFFLINFVLFVSFVVKSAFSFLVAALPR